MPDTTPPSTTLDITPSVPGVVRSAMRLRAQDLELSAANEGARLWILAAALPTVPAGQLLALVQDRAHLEERDDGWHIVAGSARDDEASARSVCW